MTEIKPVNNPKLYANNTVKQDAKVEAKAPEEVKNGKKKIVLAIGALAVAGTAAVAIAAKKGKINFDKLKNIADDTANAAKETVNDVGKVVKETVDNAEKVVRNSVDDIGKEFGQGKKGIENIENINEKILNLNTTNVLNRDQVKFKNGIPIYNGETFQNGFIKTSNKNGDVLLRINNGAIESSIYYDNSGNKVAKSIGRARYPKEGENWKRIVTFSEKDDSVSNIIFASKQYKNGTKISARNDIIKEKTDITFLKDGKITDKYSQIYNESENTFKHIFNGKTVAETGMSAKAPDNIKTTSQIGRMLEQSNSNLPSYNQIQEALSELKNL